MGGGVARSTLPPAAQTSSSQSEGPPRPQYSPCPRGSIRVVPEAREGGLSCGVSRRVHTSIPRGWGARLQKPPYMAVQGSGNWVAKTRPNSSKGRRPTSSSQHAVAQGETPTPRVQSAQGGLIQGLCPTDLLRKPRCLRFSETGRSRRSTPLRCLCLCSPFIGQLSTTSRLGAARPGRRNHRGTKPLLLANRPACRSLVSAHGRDGDRRRPDAPSPALCAG
jgi:hypothetical protein